MSTDTTTRPSSSSSGTTSAWRLVAAREITTRVREKSFIISTLVVVVVVVGGIVLAGVLGDRPSTKTLVTVGDRAAAVAQAANDSPLAKDDKLTVKASTADSVAAAERQVRDGDVDAALVQSDDGFRLLGERSVDDSLQRVITAAAASTALQQNASAQGVDLGALQSGTQTTTDLLSPDSENAGARTAAAYAMILIFFLTALSFGMAIAQSVTQEKESRIVEILAAAVPIRALLWGKVAGNTALALGQTLVLVVAGAATLLATGRTVELGAIGGSLAWFVLCFVLGFGSLATLWAVAGSLASRQQDLGSTSLPVQVFLFVPYFVAFSGNDSLKEVVSMLPIVSMIIMPSRIAEGGVPLWQIGVAVAGTVVAAVLLVRLGVAIYERSLLRTGKKLGFREALALEKD